MKRIFITTLLLLFISSAAVAQYDTEIDFGLRVKFTRTTLNLTDGLADFTDGGHDTGYQAGVFLRIRVNHLYFQPELLFADTKSRLTSPSVAIWNDVQVDFDFKSLEVPLMLGYKLGPVRIMAGPVLSFLMSTDAEISTSTTGVAPPALRDGVEDAFNSISVLARFGAGVDLGKFSLDLQYEYGLSKLYEEILIVGQGDSVKKQNEWVLGIGYRLFKVNK